MQTVTASEIKKNSTILQNALKGDLLVTKQDKPFVVVIDYGRYRDLIEKESNKNRSNWIEQSFGILKEDEADALLEEIKSSRVNKEINI